MRTNSVVKINEELGYAAQNAQLGLINATDLSLLTGVEATRLNSFAKKGFLGHYGEYHGKRFFNFEEIVNWVNDPTIQDEAKSIIQSTMKTVLQQNDCPYSLVKEQGNSNGSRRTLIVWKKLVEK